MDKIVIVTIVVLWSMFIFKQDEIVNSLQNKLKEKEVVRTNKSFADLEKEEANEYLGTNLNVEANKKQISETEWSEH